MDIQPSRCIIRASTTFVNNVYTIKMTQLRQFGIPVIAIFPCASPRPSPKKKKILSLATKRSKAHGLSTLSLCWGFAVRDSPLARGCGIANYAILHQLQFIIHITQKYYLQNKYIKQFLTLFFSPHNACMFFVRILSQTAIISLYNFNWLVF